MCLASGIIKLLRTWLVLSSLTSDLGKSQGSLKFGCFSIWLSLFAKLTAAHHSYNAFLLHATYTTASSLAFLLKKCSRVCVCVSRMRASANVYATEDNFWESILLPCGSPGVNCHQVWSQMPSPSEPSHCHYLLSSSWAVNPRVKLPSYCTLKSAHRHSLQLTARGPGTPTVLSNGLP